MLHSVEIKSHERGKPGSNRICVHGSIVSTDMVSAGIVGDTEFANASSDGWIASSLKSAANEQLQN